MIRSIRVTTRPVGVGLLVVLATACGFTAGVGGYSYRIATATPDSHLLTILDGQLHGQGNSDGTACLWIGDHGSPSAVIWPLGSVAQGNPITVYDSRKVKIGTVGEHLRLGGGLVVSKEQRQPLGCADLSQSVVAAPLPVPIEAAPGSQLFGNQQISEMQDIVNSYRDVFGGLWGDPNTRVVTISLVPAADPSRSAAARAALAGVPPETDPIYGIWHVGFVTSGPSLSALDQVLRMVESGRASRSLVGNHIVSWGIDPSHHAVIAGVDQITPSISNEAYQEFSDLVILETTSELPHLV